MGGGTRLKVVEALAMGRPLVSTTLGCEGIEVRTGEHLLVADDAAGFAAAVLRLFEDPCRGEVLAHAGRALMVEKYSWERSAQRLEVLYEEVLSQGQRFGDAGARRTTAARGPL
jgi:glycosyltransferase involved in cell wall biosynthesis